MQPDLYALVIRLVAERGGPLPPALGHQAQAMFFELVRQVDPELANALHADAQSKPFTVAVLPQIGSRRAERQAALELRVTLTHADLFAPFTRALLQQTAYPALRLGNTALALTDVVGTPGSHPWAGYSAFAALAEAAAPTRQITLEFATATAFGQGQRADGRPRLALLPEPGTVFKSIATRWNELAPPLYEIDMQMAEAAWNDTVISRYSLESCQISLGKGPQKGFVGTCSYELPSEPELARLIALLADAVFYLGIGMKTGRGMGACRSL